METRIFCLARVGLVNASPLLRLTGTHPPAIQENCRQIGRHVYRVRLSRQTLVYILLCFRITIRGQLLTDLAGQIVDLPRGNRNLSHHVQRGLCHFKGTRDAGNVQDAMKDRGIVPVTVKFQHRTLREKNPGDTPGNGPPVRPEWPRHPVLSWAGISSSRHTFSHRLGRAVPWQIASLARRSWLPLPPERWPSQPGLLPLPSRPKSRPARGRWETPLSPNNFPQPAAISSISFNFCFESFPLDMSCSSLNLRRPNQSESERVA